MELPPAPPPVVVEGALYLYPIVTSIVSYRMVWYGIV